MECLGCADNGDYRSVVWMAFLTAPRDYTYTKKGQSEGPECPTQNMGGNPQILHGSLEGVTDLLLGRYAQGLIIKGTR